MRLIELIFWNVALIFGVYVFFHKPFAGFAIKEWLLKQTGRINAPFANNLFKPLFNCPVCMASIWGIMFWILNKKSIFTFDFIIYEFSLMGIIYIILGLIQQDPTIE